MANSTLRAILTALLICGSSLLVPHHLHAQTSGWGTANLIGPTFATEGATTQNSYGSPRECDGGLGAG